MNIKSQILDNKIKQKQKPFFFVFCQQVSCPPLKKHCMARGYLNNVIEIAPARFICPRKLSNAPNLETIAEEEYKSGQVFIEKKVCYVVLLSLLAYTFINRYTMV